MITLSQPNLFLFYGWEIFNGTCRFYGGEKFDHPSIHTAARFFIRILATNAAAAATSSRETLATHQYFATFFTAQCPISQGKYTENL